MARLVLFILIVFITSFHYVAGVITLTPPIFSFTHSEEEKWYSNNDPEFSWKIPVGVIGTALLMDKNPNSQAGFGWVGKITSKKYENLGEGTWYFHLKFQSAAGWEPPSHHKVLIDTIPPKSFEIKIERKNESDPKPILRFETSDETSGIQYYEVKIEEKEAIKTTDSFLQIPYSLAVGKNNIEVSAVDKAGNSTKSQISIEVKSSNILQPSADKTDAGTSKNAGEITINLNNLINYRIIAVILAVLLAASIAVIFYIRYKFNLKKRKLQKETREIGDSVKKSIDSLKEKIENEVEQIDSQPGLTESEKRIRNNLNENLKNAEESIVREIKDVEKELE